MHYRNHPIGIENHINHYNAIIFNNLIAEKFIKLSVHFYFFDTLLGEFINEHQSLPFIITCLRINSKE